MFSQTFFNFIFLSYTRTLSSHDKCFKNVTLTGAISREQMMKVFHIFLNGLPKHCTSKLVSGRKLHRVCSCISATAVQLSSYGCTREVYQVIRELESSTRCSCASFDSCLTKQTHSSFVDPIYSTHKSNFPEL